MTAHVIGELTADERRIVLITDGEPEDQGTAAGYLHTLTPLLSSTDSPGALQLPATWASVVQLAATFGPWWRPGPRLQQWTYRQLLRRTGDPGDLAVRPPAGLVPRPYQVAGARTIGLLGSAFLFDDPGTGKTASTILGIRERIAEAGAAAVLPVVVLSPSSGVTDSWLEHFATWAPELRARPWTGSPGRRRRRVGTADVYVATYGTAARDAKTVDVREIAKGKSPLIEVGARFVVADEAHKLKDPGSTYSRAARNLALRAHGYGGGFVGLTGTPITHSPKDLWPMLYCLAPAAFPSGERWAMRYCDTMPGDYGVKVLGLNRHAEPEFRNTILGQYRRVSKADVLSHLPPKVYSVRQVELPEKYRKVYDEVERTMLAEMPEGGGELSPMNVLSQMGALLQLASAAADVRTWFETVEDEATGLPVEKRHQEITLKAPSWKVDALLDILAERPGQHCITFAPSRQLMMLAGQAATEQGYRVGYVVGGQSAPERRENVRAFQAGELDLICITTGAGGVGLTLTAASTVVGLQRPWSIVESLQIEDRAHRIGSEVHDSIEIIDVVAKNTLESRVRALLKDKAQQLSDLVMDPRIVAELLGGAGVRDLRRKAAA